MTLHSLSAPELTKLRSGSHWSIPMLVIPETPAVFKARVNQSFSSRDRVYEVTYNNVTFGAKEDVKAGMVMLVGTSDGGAEIGVVRIRKSPSASKIFIGQTSDLRWSNSLYLTVLRDYGLFAKQAYTNKTTQTLYMDRDIAYSDQHTDWQPFVNMGGDRIIWLDETPSITYDATAGVPGSTIATWAWSASGGTWTDADTATPTLTLSTTGTYQIDCTVTADNGKSITGHRIVVAISLANVITDFTLETVPSWDFARGGWEFGVRMRSSADVRDRQRCFLIARDFYNGAEGSLGQVAGSENIIASGWIAGESLDYGSDDSSVAFDVYGAHYWLGNQPGSLLELNNTGAASPAKWTEISGLTPDLALAHILHWRSTASAIMDISLTGDTRQAKLFQEQSANLWDQMANIAWRIKAVLNSDCMNGLYAFIDPQFIPEADRSAVPVIMDVIKPDWEALTVERVVVNPSASMRMIGESFISLETIKNYYAVAAGNTPKRFGYDESGDAVLVASQTQLNTLTGLALGQRNNPYPEITLDLAQNNRGITGVPAQYLTLSLSAGDNPRGVAFSGSLIPRAISHEWDEENSCFLTSVTCEAACSAELAVRDTMPTDTPLPPIAPPVITPPEPPIPEYTPPVSRINRVVFRDYLFGIFYSDTFADLAPTWLRADHGLPTIPQSIERIFLTGSKNLIVSYGFVYDDTEANPASGVWGGPVGGTQQQLLDYAALEAVIGAGATYRVLVAVSPFDDSVAVMAQSVNRFDGTVPHIFVGTSAGGFVAGATLPFKYRHDQNWQTFSYGDGVWRFTRWDYYEHLYTVVFHIAQDGSAITYDSGILNAWDSYNEVYPLDTAGKFWLPFRDGKLTSDNGLTFTDFPVARPADEQGYWQAIAINLTGTVMMWASSQPLSVDSGANWAAFVAFPGTPLDGSRFFFYGGQEWIASSWHTGIFNSLDDGVTWVDKTGNFPLLITEGANIDIVELYGI